MSFSIEVKTIGELREAIEKYMEDPNDLIFIGQRANKYGLFIEHYTKVLGKRRGYSYHIIGLEGEEVK